MYTSQINKIMEPIKHPYVLPKTEPAKIEYVGTLFLLIFIIHSFLHHCTLILCKWGYADLAGIFFGKNTLVKAKLENRWEIGKMGTKEWQFSTFCMKKIEIL